MNKLIKNSFENKQKAVAVALCLVCAMFLVAGSFSSCSKDNEEPAIFFGKWKLVKLLYTDIQDVSESNVVYEFQPNGVLIVTEATNAIPHGMYAPGEYFYSIDTITKYPVNNPIDRTGITYIYHGINLIIEEPGYIKKYVYYISSKELRIDLMETNGAVYYSLNSTPIFKKINQ